MTKIAFIGGGSVLWVPDLLSDIALTSALAGAQVVLHDIDLPALQRMLPVARRIVKQLNARIEITAELDRAAALRQADFVVLCVSIGGLEAMRNDLEIPQKYGIYQSVGDTVGPGGLARALRHIPFAVQVAREMEALCPDAWLLNLTNPMTVICRAVCKATAIRTIGLCHEVHGVRQHLAGLFDAPLSDVVLTVGGINHLPVILGCRVGDRDGSRDGFALLREYLEQHDPLADVDRSELSSPFQVFRDQFALKFSLFQHTGVFYGAGDRHVAEFFPSFLNDAAQRGLLYGIHLTTVDHRLEILRTRQESLADYIPPREIKKEQLAPLMAALLGGSPGRFVLNIPNRGQIDNLPRTAVVECMAYVDRSGVWPLAVGKLPPAAHAVIGAHVDRQELVVEAALSSCAQPALVAMSSEPLLRNPQDASALLDELLKANAEVLARLDASPHWDAHSQEMVADLNAHPAAGLTGISASQSQEGYSVDHTPIGRLMEDPAAQAVLLKHFGALLHNPQLRLAYDMTFKSVAHYAPLILTKKKLQALDEDLKALRRP